MQQKGSSTIKTKEKEKFEVLCIDAVQGFGFSAWTVTVMNTERASSSG